MEIELIKNSLEAISKIPSEENKDTTEVNKAKIVFDFIFKA